MRSAQKCVLALNNQLSLGEDDNVFETNKIARDFDIREGFSLNYSAFVFNLHLLILKY